MYSSATSTVEKCDEWTIGSGVSNGSLGSSAAKGELLELAVNQVSVKSPSSAKY